MGMVGTVTEPPSLAGRQLMIDAINDLLTDLDQGAKWENETLPAFLEALAVLLGSIENSYTNTDRPVPGDPWEIMSATLRGARYYE